MGTGCRPCASRARFFAKPLQFCAGFEMHPSTGDEDIAVLAITDAEGMHARAAGNQRGAAFESERATAYSFDRRSCILGYAAADIAAGIDAHASPDSRQRRAATAVGRQRAAASLHDKVAAHAAQRNRAAHFA